MDILIYILLGYGLGWLICFIYFLKMCKNDFTGGIKESFLNLCTLVYYSFPWPYWLYVITCKK